MVIAERLVDLDPGNTIFQQALSVSYQRLGDLDRVAGRLTDAARRYRQALVIAERLAELDPGNTRSSGDLSFFYDRLRDILGELQNHEGQ